MSLRARLLVGVGFVAIVLAVSAFVITRNTDAHLIDQVDTQLREAAPTIGRFHGGPGGPSGGGPEDAAPNNFSSLYVGAVSDDGRTVTWYPPNVYDKPPPEPDLVGKNAVAAATSEAPFTVSATSSDLRYRALAARDGVGDVFVIAAPLDDVDAAIKRLITVEVAATLSIVLILGLVTWWVIRLGVRPIKQMTATATAIAGGDLSHRVPDVTPGTEAGELGTALNQMLGRIEAAFDERTASEARLRQFVADASHELRTPVTTIRGYAELYRSGGLDDADELASAMRRTEQEAVRMGALVDDLLHLARLDQGSPLEQEPVDLGALVEDAVTDARATDPDRPITASTAGEVTVRGDDRRLRQVVGNLVGNAIVHTPPTTPIEVRLRRDGDRAVLEVVDHGPGMSDQVAARAFERFYRADPARSRHRGGSGLGLAIVEATVSAHHGTVTLESAIGEGTTVRVELPVGAPDA